MTLVGCSNAGRTGTGSAWFTPKGSSATGEQQQAPAVVVHLAMSFRNNAPQKKTARILVSTAALREGMRLACLVGAASRVRDS